MNQEPIEAAKGSRARPATPLAGRSEEPAESAQNVRVLVVEDEWLISTEIEAALIDSGYVVVGVASGADEAVAMAGRLKPDMATMDIRLSGERSGIDAAHELYRRFGVRCLFVSAHSAPELLQQADAARPLGWLTKPFLSSDLVRPVEAAVRAIRKT
jgi:DNA-binding NarL/FixJ family response regulator